MSWRPGVSTSVASEAIARLTEARISLSRLGPFGLGGKFLEKLLTYH